MNATHFSTVEVSDPALAPEGLVFVTVKSPALRQRADLTLFQPRQAAGQRGVPVVVLLHGVYGSHWAWAFKGAAHRTLQRLVDAGEVPPMVLAMPSDGLWGDGSGYLPHGAQDFERWIVEDVPAAVRTVLPACEEASPRCIAGLSMGGWGALRLAGRHPQAFVAAAGHSSLTEAAQWHRLLEDPREAPASTAGPARVIDAWRQAAGPLPRLRLDCGLDDPWLAANRQLHADLQAAGIPHEYAEHPGGHDWPYWTVHLEDTLRFFARALAALA